MKRVSRYDTTRIGESTGKRRKSKWDQKMQRMECLIYCMIWWYEMRWDEMRWDEIWCQLSTPGVSWWYTTSHSVHLRYACIFVLLPWPVTFHHLSIPVHLPSLSPLPSWLAVVVRIGVSRHNLSLAIFVRDTAPRPSDISLYPNMKEPKNNINPTETHQCRLKGTLSTQRKTTMPNEIHKLKGKS